MRCATSSASTSPVADVRPRTPVTLTALSSRPMKRVLPLLALCALAGCYSESTETSPTLGTVGNAPEPTATTLLPEVFNTDSDLTVTAPPNALFNGDLCTALVTKDFLNVRIAGLAPGALINSGALSPDSCGYTCLLYTSPSPRD